MAHSSRSFDRWLLSQRRFFAALSAGSLAGGTSRTSAPLLALSTGPMMFPAPWQIPEGPRSLRLVPKFRLTSLGSCSGGAVLALVRPVVPYTLALSSACSAGGVSGSALYNTFLADRLPPKLPTAGWLFTLAVLLSFSNLKYSRKSQITKNTQNTTISNRCLRWLQKRSINHPLFH